MLDGLQVSHVEDKASNVRRCSVGMSLSLLWSYCILGSL